MATRPGSASTLLVVDMQVGVVGSAWERDRIIANVVLAVRKARAAGVSVIWVQHHDDELVRESPGWMLVPELVPQPGERLIHKRFNSAFEGTDLLSQLDARGVSRVFLAGASTNYCIRATAYAALERGFDVTLISDAHTTTDLEPRPGRVIDASTVIDDLNMAMHWLSYPGRVNAAVSVADASFA